MQAEVNNRESNILLEIDNLRVEKDIPTKNNNLKAKANVTLLYDSRYRIFIYKILIPMKRIVKKLMYLFYRIIRKLVKIFLKVVDPSLLEITTDIKSLREDNSNLRKQIIEIKEILNNKK